MESVLNATQDQQAKSKLRRLQSVTRWLAGRAAAVTGTCVASNTCTVLLCNLFKSTHIMSGLLHNALSVDLYRSIYICLVVLYIMVLHYDVA